MASKYAKTSGRSGTRARSRHLIQRDDNLSDGNTSDVEFIADTPAQPLKPSTIQLYSGISKVNHTSNNRDENSTSSASSSIQPSQFLGRTSDRENVSLSLSFERRKRKRLSNVLFAQPTRLRNLSDPRLFLTPEQSALNYIISNLQFPTVGTDKPLISHVWPSGFSPATVVSNIDYLLANHINETIEEFASLDGRVSLLLKLFTVSDENGNNVFFLAIIGTWLDEKLRFKERLLDFSLCKADNDNKDDFVLEVAKSVFETLEEYRFLQKVFGITYDPQNILIDRTILVRAIYDLYNGQGPGIFVTYSLVSAIDSIAIKFLQSLDIEPWTLAQRYDQSAHDRPLSQDSDKEWQCIDCIRFVSLYYSDSVTKQRDWLSLCANKKLSHITATSILLDNRGDWLSTYRMLSHSLFLRKAFDEATKNEDLVNYSINDNEWKRIEQLVKLLHILKNFTDLFKTQQPLLNLSVMTLWKIKDVLSDIVTLKGPFSNFNKDLCKKFKRAFVEKGNWVLFEREWPERIFQFASMLDPRQLNTVLSERCANEELHDIETDFEEFISQYKPENLDDEPKNLTETPDHKDPFNGLLSLGNPTKPKRAQTSAYLSQTPISYNDITESEPMLIWWQSNKLTYPYHFAAACDLLGAPGSVEGAVERLFGEGFESLLKTQWMSVSPEFLRKLVILRAKSLVK